jgi:hypothetical protein
LHLERALRLGDLSASDAMRIAVVTTLPRSSGAPLQLEALDVDRGAQGLELPRVAPKKSKV